MKREAKTVGFIILVMLHSIIMFGYILQERTGIPVEPYRYAFIMIFGSYFAYRLSKSFKK